MNANQPKRERSVDWDRLEAALDEALALAIDDRPAFLDGLKASDPTLANRLRSLLDHVLPAQQWFFEASSWIRSKPERPARRTRELDPMVGRSLRHFEVQRRLGRGGMGVVFGARDTRLDRRVALKFLSRGSGREPGARNRLLSEARAAAALDHPNICTVYEVGETEDGRPFIAMAFYEGRTLKRLMAEKGPLPADRVVDIGLQIARALAEAHDHGIVHRDIKPSNVMVTSSGMVKLLDFGVAVQAEDGSFSRRATVGTLPYMAPEQVAGHAADGRADLWALGVVLWEMLAGRRPFAGESTVDLVDAIEIEQPDLEAPAGRFVDPRLRRLVEGLLQKDSAKRIGRAQDVVYALEQMVHRPTVRAD